ncbi:hypothetical protein RYH80_07130 [Halobaculum sp. MBLA0147]|uniref:hypothetical protein n=1 Tax=Halobaculum sp. MBLA0147 TaxID=3079934 RepID=UPI003525BB2D
MESDTPERPRGDKKERNARQRARRELQRALATLDAGGYAQTITHLAKVQQHLATCMQAALTRAREEPTGDETET